MKRKKLSDVMYYLKKLQINCANFKFKVLILQTQLQALF